MSSLATYRFQCPENLHQERLDKVVHALLNEQVEGGVSKALARKLVIAGAAYLAGRRCRIASKPVWSGTEVRVEYDAGRVAKNHFASAELSDNCILYHHAGILVVNKPVGMPTVATLDNARHHLVAAVATLLRAGGKCKSYVGVHHRLDAQTSGCILFTTDPARNAFVSRLFQEHLVKKEYLAVVHVKEKAPPKVWEIKDQLVRVEKKKNRYASTRKLGKPDSEGSFAYSRFELLDQRGELALIRCIPVTGRTHQLRVHLTEYGLPIVGDRLYGGAPASRLMLHAYRLVFREEDGSAVSVEAPPPQEFKRLFAL